MIGVLLGFAFAVQEAPVDGVWSYREGSDPAKPKSASAFVRNANGARLVVRCDTMKEPIVSVQYMPKPALEAGTRRAVTLVADGGAPQATTWSFPGRGAFNGEAADVFAIAQLVAHGKTVRIGFPDGAGQVADQFPGLGGDDTLFRKVYAMCGIDYAAPASTAAPATGK